MTQPHPAITPIQQQIVINAETTQIITIIITFALVYIFFAFGIKLMTFMLDKIMKHC